MANVNEALDRCSEVLEESGLIYIIVVQTSDTKLTSARGNVERQDAAQMLREAADAAQALAPKITDSQLQAWAARAQELGVDFYCPTCDGECKGEQFHAKDGIGELDRQLRELVKSYLAEYEGDGYTVGTFFAFAARVLLSVPLEAPIYLHREAAAYGRCIALVAEQAWQLIEQAASDLGAKQKRV